MSCTFKTKIKQKPLISYLHVYLKSFSQMSLRNLSRCIKIVCRSHLNLKNLTSCWQGSLRSSAQMNSSDFFLPNNSHPKPRRKLKRIGYYLVSRKNFSQVNCKD
jgi:hypothetical protein